MKRTHVSFLSLVLLMALLMFAGCCSPPKIASLGVNLNLTIKGGQYNRELYWPAPKDTEIATQPGLWGSMELAPGK